MPGRELLLVDETQLAEFRRQEGLANTPLVWTHASTVVTMRMVLWRTSSIRRVWAPRHHAGVLYSDVEYARERDVIFKIFMSAINPDPAFSLSSATHNFVFLRNASMWWPNVRDLFSYIPRLVGTVRNGSKLLL